MALVIMIMTAKAGSTQAKSEGQAVERNSSGESVRMKANNALECIRDDDSRHMCCCHEPLVVECYSTFRSIGYSCVWGEDRLWDMFPDKEYDMRGQNDDVGCKLVRGFVGRRFARRQEACNKEYALMFVLCCRMHVYVYACVTRNVYLCMWGSYTHEFKQGPGVLAFTTRFWWRNEREMSILVS